MRILFAGGGTGGHFFPIIAIVRELKRIAEENRILDLELYFMGPRDFAEQALRDEEIIPIFISGGKIRRYASVYNIFDIPKTVMAIIKAVWNMFLIMPDVVFSKGGYGALPGVVAAIIFRIPFIIHESDAIPGRVSLFSSRFASRIGIAFIHAEQFFPKEKLALVGVPIRKRILGGSRDDAKESMAIFTLLPVIAFLGASQGAQKINEVVLAALKELTDEFEILHQTGERNFQDTKEEASVILEFAHKERYHPFGFLNEDELRDFYHAADIVVSRASATSLFEIAAWGKPSIIIPLRSSAEDHQVKNAYEYVSAGAGVLIREENLTPHLLIAEIKKVFGDPVHIKKMGVAAQRFARIDSAETIADEIIKLAEHSKKS